MKKKGIIWISMILLIICMIPDTLVLAQNNFWLSSGFDSDAVFYMFEKKNYSMKTTMQVEKGAQYFYIGDYIGVGIGGKYGHKTEYASWLKEVTYTSSHPDIATVNEAGLVTMHKTGRTNIKLSYKGMRLTIPVEIVSSMKCKKPPAYKERLNRAKEIIEIHGAGRLNVTKKNRNKIQNALTWNREMHRLDGKYRWTELWGSYFAGGYYYNKKGKDILYCFPELQHALMIDRAVQIETGKAEKKEKGRRVKNITGSGKEMTLTWNKKLTEDALFIMQVYLSQGAEILEKNGFSYGIEVIDLDTGKEYYGTACPKKGKKTMQIKLDNGKLQKGHTYYLRKPQQDYAYGYYEYTVDTWFEEGKKTFVAE